MKMWNSCKKFLAYNWNEIRSIVILSTIFILAIMSLILWLDSLKLMLFTIIR